MEYISQYSTDIRHVAGADNAVADALSRAAIEEVRLGVDFGKMAELQQQDAETMAYRTAVTALRWEDIAVDDGQRKLLCDVSTGVPRPLVPAAMRREVFDVVHGLSHPGTSATVRIMTSKFVWHGIAKDVRAWACGCIECQTAKVHRHNKAPLQKFDRATTRFTHVHVDLVGPLPASGGYTHLLTGDRSVHQMARGHSTLADRCGVDRPSFRLTLGRKVRSTIGYHIGPGSSVYVIDMASTCRIAGSQGPSYNGLPPAGERPS